MREAGDECAAIPTLEEEGLTQQSRRSIGRCPLLPRKYVAVNLEGEGDGVVAESFGDDSGVYPGCHELGCVGMAESVEGDVGDRGCRVDFGPAVDPPDRPLP